jgi:hypothetical protein
MKNTQVNHLKSIDNINKYIQNKTYTSLPHAVAKFPFSKQGTGLSPCSLLHKINSLLMVAHSLPIYLEAAQRSRDGAEESKSMGVGARGAGDCLWGARHVWDSGIWRRIMGIQENGKVGN